MVTTDTSSAYESEIRLWQQEMEANLRAEDGWLTLAGLYWLHPGSNTIGTNPGSDIILPDSSLPDFLGVIEFIDEQTMLQVEGASPVTVDGHPTISAALRNDHAEEGPSVVKIGSVTFFVIRRGQEYGVRVRDANHPSRLNFAGRKWFPVSQDYRVEGRFVLHETPRVLDIPTSTGRQTSILNPGRVEFTLNHQLLSLEAFEADSDLVWFIFRDATSNRTTYGAGRFMYGELRADGTVLLDFNKAYHPPCAFTPFATCPLPPRENWLTVEISAGERS